MFDLSEQGGFTVKAVLNDRGVLFFPVSQEHRDQKAEGISNEDDYKGNALAAMIAPGKIEIRYHADFSDHAVKRMISRLQELPELGFLKEWKVTYQGRFL